MDKRIIAGLLVIAVIAIGAYLFLGTGAVVSAVGQSTISAQPDEVSVYINIQEHSKSAQEAKDSVNTISQKVLSELERIGISKDEISLEGYQIYPEYSWDNGKQEQKGYIASQQITVKYSDFEKTAGVVDAAVNSGALVSYINFEVSDKKQSEYKAQALESAGRDAKMKAEATAAGVGKKIGKLVSIQNQEFNYYPYRYYDSGGLAVSEANVKAMDAAVNINPKDIEVTAQVAVEYKLRSF